MKQTVKLVSGLMMALVVIGAVTILAIKYFDVLVKVLDNIKEQFAPKKPSFLGDACCDFSEDQEDY